MITARSQVSSFSKSVGDVQTSGPAMAARRPAGAGVREREVPSRQGFPLLIRDLNAPIPKARSETRVRAARPCASSPAWCCKFSIRKVDNFAIELPLSFGYMDVIQRHLMLA